MSSIARHVIPIPTKRLPLLQNAMENKSLTTHYNAAYYDVVYANFGNQEFSRCWALGSLATMGLENTGYASVLEFGAGLGQNLALIRADKKWAVDINPQSKVACESRGFTWVDSLDQVPDGAFDIAIARHSLEHVTSPYVTLMALRRKLKAQGKLFLVVPLETNALPDTLNEYDEHCHLFSWTPMTLKNLLVSTGWKTESLKTHNGLLLVRSLPLLNISVRAFIVFRNLLSRFAPQKSAEIIAVCTPADVA